MTKSNTKSNPLGTIHRDSIRRVADVPQARRGDYNTTPGNREKPIIITPRKEKAK